MPGKNEIKEEIGEIMGGEILTLPSEMREEALAEGRMEGRAEGRVEGRAEGLAEGLAEGRAEGRVEGRMELILALVQDGILTLEIAAQKADITVDALKKLMKDTK